MEQTLLTLDKTVAALGRFPACFAFSVHKAGSTLMHEMIRDACAACNIPAISLPDLFFQQGTLDSEWAVDPKLLEHIQDGRVYYGFRYLPEFLLKPASPLQRRKSVLLVRDPRDILVSQYFSFGVPNGSHVVPSASSQSFRDAAIPKENVEINNYVLNSAPSLHLKLVAYNNHLMSGNVRLFRYEEIYYNKHQFLQGIFEHFNIAVPAQVVNQVAGQHDIRPTLENPKKHIRQGAPGDHRRKLRSDTIAQLTDQFHDIGQSFGYNLTS
jgi:hypothetical protein